MMGRLALALALALCAGCAATAQQGSAPSPMPDGRGEAARREPARPEPIPTPAPTPASPLPGTPVGSTVSGGSIRATSGGRPAVLDTVPSSDAKAVLQGIPEPLPASERVPARTPAVTETPSAGPDSTTAPSESSESGPEGDVPVPEPTRPLGDRPRPPLTDTSAVSSPAATPSPAPAPPPAAPSTPAKPDTCWRLQLAAVPEAERADRLKRGAESQLDVACVIQKEKSLYKVRTRDCLDAAAVDRLRARAKGVGFTGAFRFRDRAP